MPEPRARLRVAIVENSPSTTGSVRSIVHAMEALRDRVECVFVGPRNEYLRSRGFEQVELDFVPLRKSPRTLLYPLALAVHAQRLASVLRERRIDVLHVNDFYNLVGVASRAFGSRVPVVYHVRLLASSYAGPVFGSLTRLVIAGSDRVLAVSDAVRADLAPSARVAVVPDGMPVPALPAPPRAADDRVDVAYLGHLIPGKGQDHALEAFARAHAKDARLRLRFVGGTLGLPSNEAFRRRLELRTRDLGLASAVTFEGPTDDASACLREADVVLNLSESESFSMSCLEAMAEGRALVASDCGGPRELVGGDGGVLVGNRDVEGAAAALVRLAADPSLRARLGAAAHERARACFDVEVTAARLFREYERAVESRAPSRR